MIHDLLYGAHLGPFSNFTQLECVQSKFLRTALHVINCASTAALRPETDFLKVEAKVWVTYSRYG